MKTWLILLAAWGWVGLAQAQDVNALRKERDALEAKGRWKESLDLYREKLAEAGDDQAGRDLGKATACVSRLGAWGEFDALVEQAVGRHPEHAGVLAEAGMAYLQVPHGGRWIAGEFERTGWYGGWRGKRGGDAQEGEAIDVSWRDRAQALRLLKLAVDRSPEGTERARAWSGVAGALTRMEGEAWKLQTLTPLDALPDWRDPGPEGRTEGAPWAGGGPVLYGVPASWEVAKNDGERWRFALSEQVRLVASLRAQAVLARAGFAVGQFGERTLQSGHWNGGDPEEEKGRLQIETLADDECLAKTSAGVRRFKLPADQHFIALYRSILDDPGLGAVAGDGLAQVYLSRRQYDRAAEVLEATLVKHGDTREKSRAALLKQIKGNWGCFLSVEPVAAGTKPRLPFEFRNATTVKFTAAPIDMDALLDDVRDYLAGKPWEIDRQRIEPGSIGWRLVRGDAKRYLGKVAAEWSHELKPKPKHADTRTELPMPLDKAGAWWVRADLGDGNTVFTVVWIVDQVLVRREVAGKLQWWVADAVTGRPVEGAKLDFFGYRAEHLERKLPIGPRIEVKTKAFAKTTDADGRALVGPDEWDVHYQWMAVSRKAGKAPAFFGFGGFGGWNRISDVETGAREVSFAVTDRPLYKAGDTVHAKLWLREVGYGEVNEARFAGKTGRVVFVNGRGEEAIKLENQKTDALGGLEVSTVLPKDAVLGVWHVRFETGNDQASASFRVEEYRKPEYEVTVEAPSEPVRLGDAFTAKVKATYFHGAPVRQAQVELTVKRGMVEEPWFPLGRWDWLYGRGSWWNAPEASWHPGWSRWGCLPPNPPWWRRDRWTPEEIVLKQTVPIGEDGTASVTIDTAAAKAAHGDLDAKYSIEARVTDASRREERATGEVIAAREPFRVVVWPSRGYAKPGEEIDARVSAATLTGKPVAKAKGVLRLFKLSSGDDGAVKEGEVAAWPVAADDAGELRQRFAVKEAGQYRLAAQLATGEGAVVEGATILNVFGDQAGGDYRFGGIELVTEKLEYQAGETAKIRVNSDRSEANVWLFLRIQDGPGREAKRIVLDGKSREIELPLTHADMPNVFVEAVTVHGGRVYATVKQLLLPPESRMLDVTLEPAAKRVKPQEKSSLAVIVRDAEGKPFPGKAVLAVYDKSLEAITGGSNVGPIREAFWEWKNRYTSHLVRDSIPDPSGSLQRPKEEGMRRLGFANVWVAGYDADGFADSRSAGGNVSFSLAPASAPMLAESSTLGKQRRMDLMPSRREMAGEDKAGGGAPALIVRKDFADLLKWSGEVVLDADGRAEVPLEFPDNLTTWKARVWVLGEGTRVGEGSAEIVASKDLLVRLQVPRFLVEKDEAVLSAVVHNDHAAPKSVKVSLELEGGTAELVSGETKDVEIAAKGEARVDWRVRAVREGGLKVRMKAEAADDGDAVERTLPVVVHGMPRQDAWSRVIEPEKESTTIVVEVPEKRRPEQTKLTVRFSPTVAGAVVDAIPYLADYPHGCTEQTLNRFVPAVIARKLVKDLGVDLGEIRAKRNNLNPQELGDPGERAAQWKRWQRNPVFDEDELERMVEKGVERLSGMQNSDGGWGWFSGYGEQSYPHTTSVVVHGLLVAKANGAKIPDGVLSHGVEWLAGRERKEAAALKRHADRVAAEKRGGKPEPSKSYEKSRADALDAFVRQVLGEAGKDGAAMLDFLVRDRLELPVYGQCLLGLELHRKGDVARRDDTMAAIAQFLKRDDENQTNFLDLKNRGYWWYWYGGEVEAHAWYLKLLAAVKPKAAETRGLVKYLVNNRKHASYWNSTRDTAFAIEAIAAYLKASGETAPEMEVEVLLDGRSLRRVAIDRENLFAFDGTVTVGGAALGGGKHTVEIRRKGGGAVYANAYLEVFTLEDFLREAGLEVKVERHLWKLVPLDGRTEVPDASGKVVAQRVEKFRREALKDGDAVASGDRVEVELVLESKNDYEYLIFSDGKAAGFEAVEPLSGYVPGPLSAYMEPRDRTVDFFLRALPRGRSRLSYQLRAEAPGVYHALPATAEAMYAPELRGNSDEIRLRIGEKAQESR